MPLSQLVLQGLPTALDRADGQVACVQHKLLHCICLGNDAELQQETEAFMVLGAPFGVDVEQPKHAILQGLVHCRGALLRLHNMQRLLRSSAAGTFAIPSIVFDSNLTMRSEQQQDRGVSTDGDC